MGGWWGGGVGWGGGGIGSVNFVRFKVVDLILGVQ